MPAQEPEDLHRLFEKALNAGSLDAILALYEPDASLIPQPGQLATGTQAIRQALSAFLAMKPTMTLGTRKIIQAGNVALLYSTWELRGTGPDGTAMDMAGQGTEVVRRQTDGTWLLVIANPYAVE